MVDLFDATPAEHARRIRQRLNTVLAADQCEHVSRDTTRNWQEGYRTVLETAIAVSYLRLHGLDYGVGMERFLRLCRLIDQTCETFCKGEK